MKVLVVGLGQMGKLYISKLIELGVKAENIIGSDISSERIVEAAGVFPSCVYTTSLASPVIADVQAAIVAVSTPSHAKVLTELMERGVKHILCEKPLTFTGAEAAAVSLVSKQTGANVYTAFLMNWSGAVKVLKEFMREQGLVLIQGDMTWGKNRMGDSRPTPGDLEDEMVHGAHIIQNLASENQVIQKILVTGMLTYEQFANTEAQRRAHELDPSFPIHPNASSFVSEVIETTRGTIPVQLKSSFISPNQVREVNGVLAHKDARGVPLYSFRLEFDKEVDGKRLDAVNVIPYARDGLVVAQLTHLDKLLLQTGAFISTARGGYDPHLVDLDEAIVMVTWSGAVEWSSKLQGRWELAYSK
jgi:hypothetical protein